MKRFVLLLASIGIGVTAHSDQLNQSHAELARELISVMKADEQLEQLVERAILVRCQAAKCDEDLRECLLKPDLLISKLGMERAASSELSADELRASITYFKSEAGQRHLDILRGEKGLSRAVSLAEQTSETRERIVAFLGTHAGYLLVTRSILWSDIDDRQIRSIADYTYWNCGPK